MRIKTFRLALIGGLVVLAFQGVAVAQKKSADAAPQIKTKVNAANHPHSEEK